MCTLAIFRQVSERYPLVVAANRDEFYARETTPPALLEVPPGVIAGRDLEAGGTWLGCRVDGGLLVAGLLNRRPPGGSGRASSGERSRGLLCLEALGAATLGDAIAGIQRDDPAIYGGFNLLLADRERAVVIDNRDSVHATELSAGLSVLTNLDVNDPRCPRLASARIGFEAVSSVLAGDPSPDLALEALAAVLGDHDSSLDPADDDPLARLCVHTDAYGTRSSTVILIDDQHAIVRYLHAPGPPCRTPFHPVQKTVPGTVF